MAKFDEFFDEHLSLGGEDIPWATTAKILTAARFCEPSSELHIAEDWIRKTALADILGVNEEKINDDRLYRGLDKVLPLKAALESHVKKQWEGLFDIKYDLLLYDITSTYFEGKMKRNPQAQRGHSRDHRPDCKQVCIGLVVTRDGMPLGYEVFPGNLHDSKTVKATVEKIESRYGKADRVWVMDRGMVSEATLTWMREGGRRYLVGLPKSELKKHSAELADPAGWKIVRDGVAVRYAQAATDETGASGDLLLLCRSDDRREKETAMLELFSTPSKPRWCDCSGGVRMRGSRCPWRKSSDKWDAFYSAINVPRKHSPSALRPGARRHRECALNGAATKRSKSSRSTATVATLCARMFTTGQKKRSGRTSS
jgi:hypothetical protein